MRSIGRGDDRKEGERRATRRGDEATEENYDEVALTIARGVREQSEHVFFVIETSTRLSFARIVVRCVRGKGGVHRIFIQGLVLGFHFRTAIEF